MSEIKNNTDRPAGTETDEQARFPLAPSNFRLMAIAGVAIVAGFLLMLGPSSSAAGFNPDIFSARRIVVGPAISFLGFLFMGFAIIYRKK